ncbi:MAG: PAS domain S-box protein [Candidatus Thiodiazotropha sp.]
MTTDSTQPRLALEHLDALFSTMSEGVAIHELVFDDHSQPVDYRVLNVNPAFCRMLGLDRSAIEGKPASEIYAQSPPPYLELYHRVATGAEPYHFETEYAPLEKTFSISVFSPGNNRFATIFSDITDHRRFEAELHRKHQEQESLIRALPQVIMHFDEQGRHLFTSENVFGYVGIPAAEFIGKTHLELGFPPKMCEFFENAIQQPFLHGKSYETRFELQKPDGQTAFMTWHLAPSRVENGRVLTVVAVARDITEQVRAENEIHRALEALEKERGFLSTLIETLPDLVWLKDPEGKYLACNPAFEKLYGASEQEIIGKNDWDFVSAEIAQFFRDHDLKAIAKGEPNTNEEWLTFASDGHKALMETTKTPMYDKQGKVIGVLGIAHDITRRMLAEVQIRRFNELLNHSSDSIFVIRAADARVIDTNTTASKALGYSMQELKEMHLWDFIPRIQDQETWLQLQPLLAEQQGTAFESEHIHRDGHRIPVEINAHFTHEEDGDYFIAIARDITERKAAQQHIQESGERYQAVLSTTSDGFCLVDTEGRLIEVNQAYSDMSGYSPEELLGMRINQLDADLKQNEIDQRMHHILTTGAAIFETRHRRKDGSLWPVEVSASYSSLYGGRVFSFLRDISERKEAERRIKYMAYNDVLTGLPNRELLADRLKQAIAHTDRAERILAICYLDLDGFKPINDEYGHEIGDRMLVLVAHRLLEDLRQGDTLARLGGDEFVLLLTELTTLYQGEQIVQRLLDSIAQPFHIDNHVINISTSVGIAIYPLDESDPDTLIRHADQAMYAAKREGKNTYRHYDPIQDLQVHQHRQAIKEFQRSLDESQLELFYQPRIDLGNAEVCSVEALVRWNHPHRGLVSPGEFLPLIRGNPLEIALDAWVLETALRQHMAWRAQGQILPVSINLSPQSVQQGGFSRFLADLLAQFPEISPGQIELEVLETASFEDIEHVSRVMSDCRELGIHFSLDDFGTGYSSLTYFHRLPISIVKVDQGFVRDMLNDPGDHDIVEGVIRLADALSRPVVAEGVESLNHGRELLRLGCHYAQGYGIARPMHANEVVTWAESWLNELDWHQLSQQPIPRSAT